MNKTVKWVLICIAVVISVFGIFYLIFLKKKTPINDNQAGEQTSTKVVDLSIQIDNFSFTPQTLSVQVGDTVQWVNKDSVEHSVVASDGSFDTGILVQGETSSVTFSKAGTFTYHCSVHPVMTGTIVVE